MLELRNIRKEYVTDANTTIALNGVDLKFRRNELGLTIKDFAKQMQLSTTYIWDIENGKRQAPLKHIDQYIKVLEIERKEIDVFYELVGLSHCKWPDLEDYLNKVPNARKFFRIAKSLNLTDNEVSTLILSLNNPSHNEEDVM